VNNCENTYVRIVHHDENEDGQDSNHCKDIHSDKEVSILVTTRY